MDFDWFAHNWSDDEDSFTDCYARIRLLARDFLSGNDKAREKHRELVHGKFKLKRNEIRINPVYAKGVIEKGLGFLSTFGISKPVVDLASLPPFSFFFQFPFTLARPYISKDDETFHICENPVRKDKVFKVPMVEGSSWKGNLRWTATKLLADELGNLTKKDAIKLGNLTKKDAIKKRLQLIRLFGAEKEGIKKRDEADFEAYLDCLFKSGYCGDSVREFWDTVRADNLVNDDGMGKGRLHFYPTFFDKIGLEVINPHDRKTKAGTIPVNIECAPVGASGHFSLLYLAPFNICGEKAKADWDTVCDALNALMFEYGFSAKKSSGYGIIQKTSSEVVFSKKINGTVKTYPVPNSLELSKVHGIYSHEKWPAPQHQVKTVNNKKVAKDFKSIAGLSKV